MADITLHSLLGQPDVSGFLRHVVASGRYGNAYLFHGPAGVGKCSAALAFARAAVCERVAGVPPRPAADDLFAAATPEPAPPAAPPDDACGTCPACRKAASLVHPDIKFLFPVSGEEKDLDATIAETLQAMRDDPLHVFQYEKAASLRISQTRELLKGLAYKPYESVRRVVVIRDCDRMREDQYSAFLKSIEEPGAATVWVLTTARLSRVPATIRSRCQRVRFAPLAESAVERFLAERTGAGESEARMLAALAGGSLTRALVLRRGDPLAQRNEALGLLQPALRRDAAGLWKGVQGATRFGKAGRETLRRAIEFHQLWLRDLLRARYGATRDALVNRDREPEVRALAETLDAAEIRRRLMVLEEALRSLDGNITADLTLFSTLARVAGDRLGEGAWPAHPAGRWDY